MASEPDAMEPRTHEPVVCWNQDTNYKQVIDRQNLFSNCDNFRDDHRNLID